MILFLGAALGFVSVAFGAFAEHGLRENISAEHFRFLMTAVRYNQVHAAVITAIGLFLFSQLSSPINQQLRWSGSLISVGTMLFSISMYFSVVFDIPALVNITPIGGMTIMAGWLLLAYAAVRASKANR